MDEVTCGGNALQFYSAVRLRLLRRGLLKSEDKVNFNSSLVETCTLENTGYISGVSGFSDGMFVLPCFLKSDYGRF